MTVVLPPALYNRKRRAEHDRGRNKVDIECSYEEKFPEAGPLQANTTSSRCANSLSTEPSSMTNEEPIVCRNPVSL
jgi:hypothetical protein